MNNAVEKAVVALEADPSGMLSSDHRKLIYESFGEASDWQANYARGYLALLSAKRVQPIYEGQVGDAMVRETIAMGQAVLAREETSEQALLYLHGVEAGAGPGPEWLNRAGLYARSAVLDALAEVCGWNGLYHDEGDAAYSAAVACSLEGKNKVPEQARALWHWWLTEAVPAAWLAATRAGEDASP